MHVHGKEECATLDCFSGKASRLEFHHFIADACVASAVPCGSSRCTESQREAALLLGQFATADPECKVGCPGPSLHPGRVSHPKGYACLGGQLVGLLPESLGQGRAPPELLMVSATNTRRSYVGLGLISSFAHALVDS